MTDHVSENGAEFTDLPPSRLGTKEYWDQIYDQELENFLDHGDSGEVWFGLGVERKVINWLQEHCSPQDSRVMDLGCGNGHFTQKLIQAHFNKFGALDYSEKAVELAKSLNGLSSTDQSIFVADILAPQSIPSEHCHNYDVIVDKGTFDAISLNPNIVAGGGSEEGFSKTMNLAKVFLETLKMLFKMASEVSQAPSYFIITSCNWTGSELKSLFGQDPQFSPVSDIPHTSFRFGGRSGQDNSGRGRSSAQEAPKYREMLSNDQEIECDLSKNDATIIEGDEIIEPLVNSLINAKASSKGKKRKLSIAIDISDELAEKESANAMNVDSPNPSSTAKKHHNIRSDLKRLLQSNSELVKYFQLKSNGNKLALIKGQTGIEGPYRFHPDTIKELLVYFEELKTATTQSSLESFDFTSFLKTRHLPLLAKLIQDSQLPLNELLINLKGALLPPGAEFPDDFVLDGKMVEEQFDVASFGHPEASGPFTALSCSFWQVRDLALLGSSIGAHFLTNFVLRQAARMILENSLLDPTPYSPPSESSEQHQALPTASSNVVVTPSQIEDSLTLMKIESGLATPKRGSKKSTEKAVAANSINLESATNNSAVAASNTKKISSFFAKIQKKPDCVVERGEYFQPFFVKPDVTLASPAALKDLKLKHCWDSSMLEAEEGYWNEFRKRRVAIPFRREKCLCVGIDGRGERNVLKLLSFEENHRPAYLGTWRRPIPRDYLNPRCPFGRVPEVDYEYESDEEWQEYDEDLEGEAESLASEDEDDEDDDELEDLEGSIDGSQIDPENWLVPHGYLSDDEGVNEDGVPTDKKEPSQPQQQKRKFMAKEPIVLGPFLCDDQVIPQILSSTFLHFIPAFANHHPATLNPFENCSAVFADIRREKDVGLSGAGGLGGAGGATNHANPSIDQTTNAAMAEDCNNHREFSDALIPSLVKIIKENPMAGMTKLFDEVLLVSEGRRISRRAFQTKLNQLTLGKRKCEKSGKIRWFLKDEDCMDVAKDNTVVLDARPIEECMAAAATIDGGNDGDVEMASSA